MNFVDLQNTFENVAWNKPFEKVNEGEVNFRGREDIYNLHRYWAVVLRMEGCERDTELSDEWDTVVISFRFYSYNEKVIKETAKRISDTK